MTDYDALNAAILDDPHAVTPRTVLADWLADHGGTVPCPACEKKPDEVNHPPGMMFVGWGHGWQPCSTCGGSAVVSDGMRERAEFVRVQVELARFAKFDPAHRKEFNDAARVALAKRMTRLERGESESYKIAKAIEEGGRLYQQRHEELRRRERELIEGRADEWFPVPTGYGLNWSIDTEESPGRPGYVVRRGFVDEVRLSLAVFVGGECERCQGRGGEDRYLEDDPTNRLMHGSHWYSCPHCSGTGRVPGLARELFAAHPLTAVRITDADPISVGGMNPPWRWLRSPRDPFGAELPDELFERIPVDPAGCPHSQYWGRFYSTRDDALTALSDAAVAYGRELAGLRPLTAPTS